MRPTIGAGSDVGRVRDGNEDSFLLQEPLFAVADGMGGHLAGDVASRIAVETISAHAGDGVALSPAELERAVKDANSAIHDKAMTDPSLHGMGTTCTLVLVDGEQLHVAHVGDSRAYLLRGDDFSQITEDHTLVGRMVKEGRLRAEDAERHPQRSIITRALGVDAEVEVDLITVPVEEGDRFLICSDGLSSMVSAETIEDILTNERDPQAAVDGLITAANEAGGEDNITAIVLAFDGDSGGATAHSAHSGTITRGGGAETATPRREPTQPGADADDMTGAFDVPKPPRRARKSRPVLMTLLLVAVVFVLAAVGFKYFVVDNSYYVGATEDDYVGIYRGLPDEVAGMTFQEEIEKSEVLVDDLPEFLAEDVRNAIEADSLSDARTTLTNLEERAQDEEFQRTNDRNKKDGNN
jgi:protein phosphatase